MRLPSRRAVSCRRASASTAAALAGSARTSQTTTGAPLSATTRRNCSHSAGASPHAIGAAITRTPVLGRDGGGGGTCC
jgi:hypothetical protein